MIKRNSNYTTCFSGYITTEIEYRIGYVCDIRRLVQHPMTGYGYPHYNSWMRGNIWDEPL